MISNKELLKYCINNPEPNIDEFYEGLLERKIIPENKAEKNELIEASENLLNIITTIETLNNKNDYSKDDSLIKQINDTLKIPGMNYSPLVQYLMVHNLNYDIYLSELDLETQKSLVKEYIKDRHSIYKNYGYSDIVYQILSDNYSHKRKADLGTKKVRIQLEKLGINHISKKERNYYINPDKGDKKLFTEICYENNIPYEFFIKKNGKRPDFLIKINNKYIIVEHKSMKQDGGGQDKQIVEVSDFIKEEKNKTYYVSYMDGIYFNKLFTSESLGKKKITLENIQNTFMDSDNSYFVNTKGFEKFISEVLNDMDY